MKAKETVRLERGEGATRMFWEITRDRASITTRFGRHLSAGRTSTKKHASPAAALAAFAKAIEEKEADGYAAPIVRGPAGTTSKKGVVTRNPELEASIEEAPDDVERYLVYADWLQQQGDVRGELIAIQHRMSEGESLERDEALLLKEFKKELLGPLAPFAFARSSVKSFRGLSWRWGFLHAARTPLQSVKMPEFAELLFEHPSARFLQHLVVEVGTTKLCEIVKAKAPKTLHALTCIQEVLSLSHLFDALPPLKKFSGRTSRLDETKAPLLEELRIAVPGQRGLKELATVSMPKLRHLTVTLAGINEPYTLPDLSKTFPALESLSFRRWITTNESSSYWDEGTLVMADDLAAQVTRWACGAGVKSFTLEVPMTSLAKVLDAGLLSIEQVKIPADAVSKKARHAKVEWTDTPEDVEVDLPALV